MGVATNSTRRLAEVEAKASPTILLSYYILKEPKSFEKKICTPYYFIHGKVVTHSGKVVFTTRIICTH